MVLIEEVTDTPSVESEASNQPVKSPKRKETPTEQSERLKKEGNDHFTQNRSQAALEKYMEVSFTFSNWERL